MASTESELIAYTSRHLNNDTSDDSLHTMVDYDTLRKLFVIHDRKVWRYLAFNTSSDYLSYRNRISPNERFHHEVIWGDLPQRIKFDIDATPRQIDMIPTRDIEVDKDEGPKPPFKTTQRKAEAIIWHIANTIVRVFIEEYGDDVPYKPQTKSDILITDSTGPDKVSFHVVLIHFKLKNNIECKYFTDKVCQKLPLTYEELIDKQINKGVQTFRIQGSMSRKRMCCKMISHISKIVDDGFIQDPEDYDEMVNGKCDYAKGMKVGGYLSPENLNKIIELVYEKWPEFAKFRDEKGGFLNFDRIGGASYCDICNKVHDRDNTLMIRYSMSGSSGPIIVSHGCRHAMSDDKDLNGMKVFHTIDAKPYNRTEALRKLRDSVKADVADPRRVFAKYDNGFINIELEDEDKIKALPMNYRSVFIRAGMKMGKTKALKEFFKALERHAEEEAAREGKPVEYPSICILSFRITFTLELHSKLDGFKVYNDPELKKSINSRIARKLIIQVESLHRVEGLYDYVVLDESESIIGQFGSNNVRNLPISDSRFQALITRSKKVICMDAYLGERTVEVIKAIRGSEDMVIYYNHHKNATEYKYEIGEYRNNDYLLKVLGDTLNTKINVMAYKVFALLNRKGCDYKPGREYHKLKECMKIIADFDGNYYRYKNVAVISNSKSDVDAIHQYIIDCHSDTIRACDIAKYSKDTDADTKKEHMMDVNKHWRKRVILYTPTVTAGISFEQKWFDKIFGIFKNSSCDVLSCIQMLGRIRHLNDKHVIIALDVKNLNCSISIDSIKRDIERYRHGLVKDLPNHIDITHTYTKNDNGEPVLDYRVNETNYWYIWAYNTKMANISRRKFIQQFYECVLVTGATIEIYDNLKSTSNLYMKIKHIKQEQKEKEAQEIALSRLPSSEELERIMEKVDDGEELDEQERAMKAKNKLKTTYDIDDSDLDKLDDHAFVMMYNNPKKFDMWRNLKAINKAATFTDSLIMIRNAELRRHEQFKDCVYQMLNIKPMYERHKAIVDLLHMLGIYTFRGTEGQGIDIDEAESIMNKNMPLIDAICKIHSRFSPSIKAGTKNITFGEIAMKECSGIASEMYGHSLSRVKKDAIYKLCNNSKFGIGMEGGLYITKDMYSK